MLGCRADDLNDCLREAGSMADELPVGLVDGMHVASVDETCLVLQADTRDIPLGQRDALSGPVLFTIVDTAGWLFSVAHYWPSKIAVTTDLSMQFLRPARPGQLVVVARTLQVGRRCVFDVEVGTRTATGPIAHAVVTFAPVRSAGCQENGL